MLAEDARLSTRAIARAVGMSPTGVSERLERLHNRGVIRGYHADIDPTALGWDVEAIIGITSQQGEILQSLVSHLMTLPEVITAYIVTGRWDILLSVRARCNQALRDFVVGTLPTSPGLRAQRDHGLLAGPAHQRRRLPGQRHHRGRQQRLTPSRPPARPAASAVDPALSFGRARRRGGGSRSATLGPGPPPRRWIPLCHLRHGSALPRRWFWAAAGHG